MSSISKLMSSRGFATFMHNCINIIRCQQWKILDVQIQILTYQSISPGGTQNPRDRCQKRKKIYWIKNVLRVISGRSRCAECVCSIKNNLSQAPVAQPTPPELWDTAVWRSRGARTRSRNWPKNDQNIGKSSKFHVFSSFSQVILAVRCSYSPRMLHARSPPILRVWTSSEQYFSSKIMIFDLKTCQNQRKSWFSHISLLKSYRGYT